MNVRVRQDDFRVMLRTNAYQQPSQEGKERWGKNFVVLSCSAEVSGMGGETLELGRSSHLVQTEKKKHK